MRMVIKKSPSGGLAGAIRYADGVCFMASAQNRGAQKMERYLWRGAPENRTKAYCPLRDGGVGSKGYAERGRSRQIFASALLKQFILAQTTASPVFTTRTFIFFQFQILKRWQASSLLTLIAVCVGRMKEGTGRFRRARGPHAELARTAVRLCAVPR